MLILICTLCILLNSQCALANAFPTFMVTQEDIDNMSTYMNYGLGTINGKWYYGYIAKEKTRQYGLGKIKLADLSDYSILDKDAIWRHLYVNKGYIYYISSDGKKKDNIRKMTITGENNKMLVSANSGDILYMFIYKDQIYYTENVEPKNGPVSGKLYRMDLDGSNKKVILNKPVYFPYIVNGKLLFQDDRDKVRLHSCDIDGKNDKLLIDDFVFSFITSGDSIYYKSIDKKPSFDKNGNLVYASKTKEIIKVFDINSGKSKILINSDTGDWGIHNKIIYYTNYDDSQRIYSYNINNGDIDVLTQDKGCTLCVFSNNGIFYNQLNNNGQNVGEFFIEYNTFKKTNLRK